MATGIQIILILLFSSWCAVVVQCFHAYPNTDEICRDLLPVGVRRSRNILGLLAFIEMCSNMLAYTRCLLRTRDQKDMYPGIFQFETKFPSEIDLFRAGYLFCIEELPQAFKNYTFKEGDIYRCENNINYTFCEVKEIDDKDWNNLVSNPNPQQLNSISCNHTWQYYNCLRDQYIKCNKNFAIMFKYYFARLGPDCLVSMNENNDLVLTTYCPGHIPSVNEGPSTLRAHIGLVLIGGLVWWLLAFPFHEIWKQSPECVT